MAGLVSFLSAAADEPQSGYRCHNGDWVTGREHEQIFITGDDEIDTCGVARERWQRLKAKT